MMESIQQGPDVPQRSQCLSENEVLDFVHRRVPPADRELAERHVDNCETCRRFVAEMAQVLLMSGAAPNGGEHASDSPDGLPLAAGTLVGRYRLLHLLGTGGMGVVYAAEDPQLRRQVALKLLRTDDIESPQTRSHLLREARLAAAVEHPNVVQIHDVFEFQHSPVLVMDLLEGESLRTRLRRERVLSTDAAVRIMLQVLDALEAAHAAGVVHRDLKPENIFLVRDAAGEQVKLLDFGTAKLMTVDHTLVAESTLTSRGMLIGTPYYMAPEQAFGESSIDGRADLWAVGVILYECLTGVRPTQADNLGQVLKLLTHRSFRPMAELVSKVPPPLARLVEQLLSERQVRPGVSETRAALASLLLAPREAERSADALRQRRTARTKLWLACGISASLVVGLGGIMALRAHVGGAGRGSGQPAAASMPLAARGLASGSAGRPARPPAEAITSAPAQPNSHAQPEPRASSADADARIGRQLHGAGDARSSTRAGSASRPGTSRTPSPTSAPTQATGPGKLIVKPPF
jgi:serine/threonine protein kinase